MPRYYVNDSPQEDEDHEVHKEGCRRLELVVSKTNLGFHLNCVGAVEVAKIIYSKADGCKHCCSERHKG